MLTSIPAPPSSMFNMFLDVCKNLITYIRKLWVFRGGVTDRNVQGNSRCKDSDDSTRRRRRCGTVEGVEGEEKTAEGEKEGEKKEASKEGEKKEPEKKEPNKKEDKKASTEKK